jgi:selenide,water dikinase
VLEFAAQDVTPGGLTTNRDFYAQGVDTGSVAGPLLEALFDPQTSGGLLIAVPSRRADTMASALRRRRVWHVRVGEAIARERFAIVLRDGA